MEHITDELYTLGDFIRWGASQFNKAQLSFGHGTDNAIDEAVVLISYRLNLQREIPDILWHTRLTYAERQEVFDLLNQRVQQRIPVPYLINQAWFANLAFYVNQDVLIPRSPIAELIEQQFRPWVEADQVKRMLDLGTGSGCIAIASAIDAFLNAEIDAVDVSYKALEVAQKNINHYQLEERVHTVYSDLFSNLAGIHYDLIVCNPPYVDSKTVDNLPDEYQYEPRIGLEAEEEGLFFVTRILREAAQYLTPNGVLIVEVGLSQAKLVEQYPDVPFLWLDFQRGGEGVFLLTAKQLRQYSDVF